MKKLLLLLVPLFFLCNCTTTKYTDRIVEVPTEKIKIEYRDKILVDTFITKDSVIIKEKNDTVLLEKYKYLYKIKEVRDTINTTDTTTITKVVEVKTVKEVNKLHSYQVILMILGVGFIVFGVYRLYKFIKK